MLTFSHPNKLYFSCTFFEGFFVWSLLPNLWALDSYREGISSMSSWRTPTNYFRRKRLFRVFYTFNEKCNKKLFVLGNITKFIGSDTRRLSYWLLFSTEHLRSPNLFLKTLKESPTFCRLHISDLSSLTLTFRVWKKLGLKSSRRKISRSRVAASKIDRFSTAR